jgi:O-antigen ligase
MSNRLARYSLELGLLAVVLAALPYKLFELDRYFVPKELVLHAVALTIGAALIVRRRPAGLDMTDALLAFFLVWSGVSALFATNHWVAQRAFGISVSSALVYWGARKIGAMGGYRPLLVVAALATVCAAATALAQAYGVDTDYFSQNRVPGGTFGNRNFVAHIAAIGLPALVWSTVTARRPTGGLLGSLGAAVVAAALVLSRSRAAWLAVAACVIVLFIPLIVSRKYWDRKRVGGRFARLVLAMTIAGTVATILPNTLNWHSESPYLDSARGMVNYKQGSGRGRIAQYRNTLNMSRANPVFGVGAGNWPVRYVKFAPANDLSIAEDGMTANPWPSSDWVAFVSERGFVAAVALLAVFASLFFGAFREWSELADGDAVLLRLVLAGTVVAAMVVSAFDAVLILAAPALLVWTILGASSGPRRSGRTFTFSSRTAAIASVALMLTVLASAVRSGAQVMSMTSVAQGGRTAGWVAGAAWDPGSYRINLKVAELLARRGRCNIAGEYARRAASLFPNAPGAKRAVRRCS